jgi:hypothetical protein
LGGPKIDESGAEQTRTMAQFGDDLVHSRDEDDSWVCFSMVDTLDFYFVEPGERTRLSVSRNNPITGIE